MTALWWMGGIAAGFFVASWVFGFLAESARSDESLDATLAAYRQYADSARQQRKLEAKAEMQATWANGDPLPVAKMRGLHGWVKRQSKCESCGSREWLPHAGKEVCAYCRSDRV